MLWLLFASAIALISAGRVEAIPGQIENASLTGLITDSTAAIVRGASVTARNSATNVVSTVQTDAAGYFLFPSLPIGEYTVSVEFPGFKKPVRSGIVLEVGQRGRSDFTLEVGAVTDFVEVQAAA